jgi:hypothetical protein
MKKKLGIISKESFLPLTNVRNIICCVTFVIAIFLFAGCNNKSKISNVSLIDTAFKANNKVHVAFDCAETVPENNNDFPCYNAMIKNFGPTLSRAPNGNGSTKTGRTLLAEAFGL